MLSRPSASPASPFPAAGGECAALLRATDWAGHPLGDPASWPVELRIAVRTSLTARFPTMVHWGPKYFTFYNDAYAAKLGRKHPGHLGQPAQEWWSEMWDQLVPFFGRVMAGESFYTEDARYTPDRDGEAREAYFTHSHSPLWDDAGQVRGIFVVVTETTERVLATRQQHLLNEEMAHRLKNTLAVVQAVARQTLRGVPDQEPVEAFLQRISALGTAHDVLLRQSWSAAPLRSVAEAVLSTLGLLSRCDMDGPTVDLGSKAVMSLSLLLHELATNAAKYGALSNSDGRVAVRWTVEVADGGEQLALDWLETGGPPVREPERKGFGSRLIRTGLVGMGGVELHYLPEGFRAHMTASLDDARRA